MIIANTKAKTSTMARIDTPLFGEWHLDLITIAAYIALKNAL
jgi:hypothetical protein